MSKIIGIDHGFGLMKTANTSFISGVVQMATEPAISSRVLQYEGKYYVVGGQRMDLIPQKTTNDNYYILTLAAIAEELKVLKQSGLKKSVRIAAGLPLKRFAEKEDFLKYLFKNKKMVFTYEKIPYQIEIEDIKIFPQGYAAVVKNLKEMPRTAIVCDFGSYTLDILPISNKIPKIEQSQSINMGLIFCINDVQEALRSTFGRDIEESMIMDVIRGLKNTLPVAYLEIIEEVLARYAQKVINKLNELGFNTDITPVYWVAGGASLIRNYGTCSKETNHFNLDIHSNARGYEYLYTGLLKK